MQFKVEQQDRIDRVLRGLEFPKANWMSRQAWERALQSGWVFVDGIRIRAGGVEVKAGQTLDLQMPELLPHATPLEPFWFGPKGDVAVFFKDSGVASYPLMPWEKDTLAQRVAAWCTHSGLLKEDSFWALAESPILEGGLVQRLDIDTSGILCVAFTKEAKSFWRQQFSGWVEKVYWAIAEGPGQVIEEITDLHLRATNSEKVEILGFAKPGSSPVQLRCKILGKNASRYWLEVRTHFGQRHIVRAVLAHKGLPLVGDSLYGGVTDEFDHGHQLHAQGLVHSSMQVYAAAPNGFTACLRRSGFALLPQNS